MSESIEKIEAIVSNLVLNERTYMMKESDIEEQIIVEAGMDKRTKRKYMDAMKTLDVITHVEGKAYKWNKKGIEKYFSDYLDDIEFDEDREENQENQEQEDEGVIVE